MFMLCAKHSRAEADFQRTPIIPFLMKLTKYVRR